MRNVGIEAIKLDAIALAVAPGAVGGGVVLDQMEIIGTDNRNNAVEQPDGTAVQQVEITDMPKVQ